MKTAFDPKPLCEYVTIEVSPLHLVQCINELTIDYLRLLLAEIHRNDPQADLTPRTYDCLFELYRVNACLLEGMNPEQRSE